MTKQLKVGAFVAFGILLLGIIVFVIGENRSIFDRKMHYRVAFQDVSGLKGGAPVRMGGVDIGIVQSVAHSDDVADARIYVTLAVVANEAGRVHTDTVARITNKGLLGDKMIELSVTATGAPAPPNSMLKSEDPVDFGRYLSQFEGIAKKAEGAIGNIEEVTKSIADARFSEDLRGALESMRDILEGVAHKDGAAHRLIFDKDTGVHLDRTLANVDALTARLDQVAADMRDVTHQVHEGPGLLHSVVYDGEAAQHTIGVLAELHRDLSAVREGNGLAHTILYGDSNTQHVMSNVNAMSDDLRKIVADMRAGKGTLGGLLVDPSIYEDVKSIVGNVDRNQVLRALVRYSIKADETKPAPAAQSAPAPQ